MPFISTIGGGSAQGFGRTVLEESAFAAASTTQSTDTTYTIGGVEYQSHTWLQANQSGNSITFTNESGNGHVNADVLLIAGGGGGGGTQNTGSNGFGGGGGAGGVIIRSGYNFSLAQYDISVGAGGAGNSGNSSGLNGTNSTIDLNGGSTVLASYGGGGGGWTNDRNGSTTQKSTPGDGGSTGGAGGGDYQGYTDGGQGNPYGQGHRGGRGTGNVQGDYGGSGGGANAGGADGTDSVGMVNQFDTSKTEGADSRGVGNAYRSGGVAKYAGGGNGYYSNTIQGTNYGGGNGQSGASGLPGTANTGGGGGGGTGGNGGGAGGSGICVIRYPIALVDKSSDMSELQSLSAGTQTIATTNGTGNLSLTVVEYNGRKWAKIPWGTETSGSIDGGHWFSNDLFSVHTYGNTNKGLSMDSSNRWHSEWCRNTSQNNTNAMSSQVIFHFGIRYRYIKTYCTGIQSHTSSGSVVTNCDWGSQDPTPANFTDDLSGGFGDHPGWIIGWDFNGDEPRYKAINGNTSSGAWYGGTGGWAGGEAGNVTRSFEADIHDCGADARGDGLYKHDKAGLLCAGGYAEFYRHNSGYFLIS